jgi:hypothetical protein
MPKKISVSKKRWIALKKELPKNWCQIVAESLNSKGFELSPQTVSDLRAGRIKNLPKQEAVWKEIKKIYKKQKSTQQAIVSIIHS